MGMNSLNEINKRTFLFQHFHSFHTPIELISKYILSLDYIQPFLEYETLHASVILGHSRILSDLQPMLQ